MVRGLYCVLVALLGFFDMNLIGSFILCEMGYLSLFLRIAGGGGGMCCEPEEIFLCYG